MGALVPGLDDQVEYLMTVAPLADDSELTRWLAAVRTAAPGEEERSVDDFTRAFRDAATEWQSTTVDTFVAAVARLSDGVRPVWKYARTLQDSSATYWQLRRAQLAQAGDRQAPTRPVDRFGWLADRQAQALAAAWGDQWQDYLGQQLDYRWGAGWEATYARTDSQGYLDQLIAEWLPRPVQREAAAAPVVPADLERSIDQAIADAIATIPGAADLTEEDLAEVRAAVRAEVSGGLG